MKHNNKEKKEVKKVICSNCKSLNIVKRGTFETKAHGTQQRYFCKKCGKKFIERTGFYRMRNTPQKITASIDLFYNGLSTRKVQAHLKAFFPHNASNVSVYNWVIKYSKKISKFTEKLKLNVGNELQIDEQAHFREGKQNWLIDSIDSKTRFVVASSFRVSRGQVEIKEVLNVVKYKTQGYVTTITSDGHKVYPRCIKKIFGYNNKLGKHNVYHNIVCASKGHGFNVPIERFHNNVRDRTKIMRGFHGSVESADTILKGYVIYYNFVRKHQGINCSPFELATDVKLNNPNRWIDLIQLSQDL